MLRGYDDGTFRPAAAVTRAEAIKLIVAPHVDDGVLSSFSHSPFVDVPDGSWFLPYIEAARGELGIIAGPPEKTAFRPADSINLAEFLKICLLSYRVDAQSSFSDLPDALAPDVLASDWFSPYVRYALASSMIMVDQQGRFNPAVSMTRGDVAQLMYWYAMYLEGRRTQALLSEAESDILNLLQMIDQKQMEQAEFASARSLVVARGALLKNPDAPVVKGAVKTTEGFQFLTQAYRAGMEGRLDDAVAKAQQAWATADRAKQLSPDIATLADQMQSIAQSIAENARGLKAGAQP